MCSIAQVHIKHDFGYLVQQNNALTLHIFMPRGLEEVMPWH